MRARLEPSVAGLRARFDRACAAGLPCMAASPSIDSEDNDP
jgi:hypothetical protein